MFKNMEWAMMKPSHQSSVSHLFNYCDMLIHQIDVVTAFLNGKLKEEIYMQQPPGYSEQGKEHLAEYSGSLCVNSSSVTVVAVSVDDLIIITKISEQMEEVKKTLTSQFKMKDLGKLHYCLGITIEQDEKKKSLCLHQRQYIQGMLEKYGLLQGKIVATPADVNVSLKKDDKFSKAIDPVWYQSMVGSLLYAFIATRPDIAQAVGAVSKFNSNPSEAHSIAVK